MKPMLCHKYREHFDKLSFPCFIQPKLNGVRLLYRDGHMQSRSHGKEEAVVLGERRLAHIRQTLQWLPTWAMLDGELYVHGWSLQRINGAARVRSVEDSEASTQLQYHIFDLVDTRSVSAPMVDRKNLILDLIHFDMAPNVQAVNTTLILSSDIGDTYHSAFKRQGYEGSVYRQMNAPYGFVEHCGNQENRWASVLKRKDFLDGEYLVVGWKPGLGKYEGKIGALTLMHSNGREFDAGSGLTDAQREDDPPIGSLARIRYEMLSDDGVPLKPVVEAIL